MDCQGQRTLFLKANGSFVCEDDVGEQVTLGKIGPDNLIDMGALAEGLHFRRMKQMMDADTIPWPLVCERCAFFRPGDVRSPGIADRFVQKIQVETTLACKLRCPGCSGVWQIKNLPGPAVLSLEMYEAMLRACRDAELKVEWIEYCGQGEPLSHRRFPQFMELTAEILPRTKQRVITNGNFAFDERFPDLLAEELIVSCDGLRQSSYEKYRINGDVLQTLEFIRRASERVKGIPSKTVVWKYILFSHNDTDEEILEAQARAEEFGIDRLLFVMTHTSNKSSRFSPGSGNRIPLKSKIARFNATPVLYRTDFHHVSEGRPDMNDGHFLHTVIDQISATDGGYFVRGWAIGDYGHEATDIWLRDGRGNDHPLASIFRAAVSVV